MSDEQPSSQEEIAQLTLKHLQEFRLEFRAFRGDVIEELHDIKSRVTTLEEGIAGVHRRLDRFDRRLDRIETRLGLVEA